MSYPPQNGPPPYGPPMPQAPPVKKRKAGCLRIGCGGVVLLTLIIGIVVAASSGSNKTSSKPAVTPPPTAAAGTRQAAPAPTTQAPAPPTTTSAKPPAPAVLLRVSGNGIKNTAKFTTGDSWTIHYTYDCSAFGSAGNFSVYVDYPNGDIPVNELGKKGSDSSTASGAGTHTLKVASECSWKLTVTDG